MNDKCRNSFYFSDEHFCSPMDFWLGRVPHHISFQSCVFALYLFCDLHQVLSESAWILRDAKWEIFSSDIKARTRYTYRWDDDVCFVLNQNIKLDYYNASSLTQHSMERCVASLGHIILMPSQQFFALTYSLEEKQQIPILQSLVWPY